jgi:hypothetical protein
MYTSATITTESMINYHNPNIGAAVAHRQPPAKQLQPVRFEPTHWTHLLATRCPPPPPALMSQAKSALQVTFGTTSAPPS